MDLIIKINENMKPFFHLFVFSFSKQKFTSEASLNYNRLKRCIQYLTIAFVLLMGYSQIFTYVFLGVISTPSARIADGAIRIHAPFNNASIFDSAIIEEMNEED